MNKYVDNNDGTITGNDTGLIWQQATADTRMTWEAAIAYCENLTLAGHSDWRLPTIQVLQSIVDYGKYNSAINNVYFPDTVPSYYWSSTTSAIYTDYAWLVNFYLGYVHSHNRSDVYYVRAVRGGQR